MNANNLDVSSRTNYVFDPPDQPDEVQKPTRQFIQTLGLNEHLPSEKPRPKFWRRQFHATITRQQRKFDWTFGVVLPVICFFFDPVVFTNVFHEEALIGAYKPFAYLLSFAAVMATIAWLLWGEKLKWLNALLAGLFAAGFAAALCVGIVLFPFSLIGSLIVIGMLGFTPLFTSFVFLRNAVRAFRTARPVLEKRVLIQAFGLSAMFSVVVPYVINIEIRNSIERVITGDPAAARSETRKLAFAGPLIDAGQLAVVYRGFSDDERNSERAIAIAEFYSELTGRSIGQQPNPVFD